MVKRSAKVFPAFSVSFDNLSRWGQGASGLTWSIVTGDIPPKSSIPDFVRLKYSFVIWCDYVAQMNKIIEAINYASDSYWGDEERFKFNARIDTFTNRVEVSQGDNRIVKTDFGLDLQGYIIPDAMNKELAKKPQKFFSTSAVVFNTEIVTTTEPSKTREEIRKESGEYKVGRQGDGIGFDEINEDNDIT